MFQHPITTINGKFNNLSFYLHSFGMFFRLFAISGVVWITEIISFLFSLNSKGISNYIDYIPCSQGILLFFVTIWKKDVLKAVYER